jgi:hypothetical protein
MIKYATAIRQGTASTEAICAASPARRHIRPIRRCWRSAGYNARSSSPTTYAAASYSARSPKAVVGRGKWLTLVELFGSHRPPRTVACRGVSTPEGRHQPRVAPNSAIKVSQIVRPFTPVDGDPVRRDHGDLGRHSAPTFPLVHHRQNWAALRGSRQRRRLRGIAPLARPVRQPIARSASWKNVV